ncbi:14211_t:CDS:2, partial [Entrophospora sp. SA101]
GLDGNNESLNILCPHDLEHQGAYDDIISYLKNQELHEDNMFRCCINLNGRKIVNHSGCATSPNWLYQSGVDDTQVMTISGHKSLKGMGSYIAPTIYQKASKINNVLQMVLTPQESSTLNKTSQKNTGSDELDDMSNKDGSVKSLGVSI